MRRINTKTMNAPDDHMKPGKPAGVVREEWILGVSVASSLVLLCIGKSIMAGLANPVWLTVVFVWLFAVILGSVASVVRHADHLAIRLGEPYGTLILTLAVTVVEVISISAMMLHGTSKPTLVRDTLFAVVMITLNGMVGLSLIVGGWKHREQQINLQELILDISTMGEWCAQKREKFTGGNEGNGETGW
jgi:Ca2+:H+ antiporter